MIRIFGPVCCWGVKFSALGLSLTSGGLGLTCSLLKLSIGDVPYRSILNPVLMYFRISLRTFFIPLLLQYALISSIIGSLRSISYKISSQKYTFFLKHHQFFQKNFLFFFIISFFLLISIKNKNI